MANDLADRTRFALSDHDFEAFIALLDEQGHPCPKLEALLARPTVFDR